MAVRMDRSAMTAHFGLIVYARMAVGMTGGTSCLFKQIW